MVKGHRNETKFSSREQEVIKVYVQSAGCESTKFLSDWIKLERGRGALNPCQV